MRAYLKAFSLACIILLLRSAYAQAPLAQTGEGGKLPTTKGNVPPSQFIVACSPDKPVVRPGDTIRLRAYATPLSGKVLRFTWSAPNGRMDRQGQEVRWDFTDVAVGVYEAKVRASDRSGGFADCSVRVIVQAQTRQPLRGGNRETGRTFLLPNEVETKGYGLYSYLLLGSRPTAATRERYLKAVEEYLRFPDLTRLETFNIPHRALNITYLPLRVFPGRPVLDQLTDEHYGQVAEWMLKQYDYDRARVLLSDLPGTHREGPYIVSLLKPPTWNSPFSRPYLFQDQSWVPPHLVSVWTKEFLNQAAQEEFWQERTSVQLVLKLRTAIGILATALPEVRKALDDWVAWVS